MNSERTILYILKGISGFAIIIIVFCFFWGIGFYLFFSGSERQNEKFFIYYYTVPPCGTAVRIIHAKTIGRVFFTIEEYSDTSDFLAFNHSLVCLTNKDFSNHWTIPFLYKEDSITLYWNHYNSWSKSAYYQLKDEDITDEKGKLLDSISHLALEADYHHLVLSHAGVRNEIGPFHTKELVIKRKEIKQLQWYRAQGDW